MAAPFSIPLSSGISVSARHYDAGRPQASLILAHGAGAGQTHPFMVRIASSLGERAIETFTFNFPYAERKRSAPDPAPVLEASYLDVVGVIRERTGKRPLFIGGKSMGGRIATQIAAHPDFSGVTGIVVLGYPLHPPGKPDTLRVKHLPAIRVPMLIVQGSRDAFGSPDELKPHLKSHGKRVTIHSVAGGDHSFAVPKSAGSQSDIEASIVATIVEWIGRAERL
jgi:uncharacterized protein